MVFLPAVAIARARHFEHKAVTLLHAKPAPFRQIGARTRRLLLAIIGIDRFDDIARIHFTPTNRCKHILNRGARQSRQCNFQAILGIRLFNPLECPLDNLLAKARILVANCHPRSTPDGRARFARHHNRFPSRRRRLPLRAHNFHLVAIP